jgi:hypothetical protein
LNIGGRVRMEKREKENGKRGGEDGKTGESSVV